MCFYSLSFFCSDEFFDNIVSLCFAGRAGSQLMFDECVCVFCREYIILYCSFCRIYITIHHSLCMSLTSINNYSFMCCVLEEGYQPNPLHSSIPFIYIFIDFLCIIICPCMDHTAAEIFVVFCIASVLCR